MSHRNAPRPLPTKLLLALALACAQASAPARGSARVTNNSIASQAAAPQKPQQPEPPRQQQAQPATPRQDEDDEVVRINTNLIQVDAVVTDEQGRPVTDLTAGDFEIIEDGRPREITNFSFVEQGRPRRPDRERPAGSTPAPEVAPARLRPEQLRRIIVLVVDDLTMAPGSAAQARRAMRQFVEEQIGPGDLVAVVRAGAGVGALQQLTSDKAQLYAAIERVRGLNKCESNLFDLAAQALPVSEGPSPPVQSSANELTPAEGGYGDHLFLSGVLGAVNLIVRGLRDLPGRKAVVLFSDGIPACEDPAAFGPRFSDRLTRIADLANRASVVVYSIDPRGLMTLDDAAVKPPASRNPASIAERARRQSEYIYYTQGAWTPLIEPTGGFAVYNNNDLSGSLRRIAAEQNGYYLIGYRPDEATFRPDQGGPRFRRLVVRVKRPSLKVRTRQGFYGLTDEQARSPRPRTRHEQLLAGLSSPFSSGQIDLRLTSLFGNEPSGSFVLSMLHIDPRDLTFAEQPDGWRQAVIDVLAVTFDADGKIVEQVSRTQTVRARGETFRRIMRSGLVYSISVPAKKPGGYQLRIAVRDAASERVGSAGQFVEVPNLGEGRLTLSGLTVSVEPAPQEAEAGGSESVEYDPPGGPALRRFRRDSVLEYGYAVYNPRPDKETGRPRLLTQVLIFRDGSQVFAGQPQPLDTGGLADPRRLSGGGRLRLGPAFPPGEYVLQVVITDELAGGRRRAATSRIDFEVYE